EQLEAVLRRLVRAFGANQIFVELQRHHIRGDDRIVRGLVEVAGRHGLPVLATNDVLYARPQARQALDVLTCIRQHTHLDAAGKRLEQNSERHLKSAEQMSALFWDLPEALRNTVSLAERLQFTLAYLGY